MAKLGCAFIAFALFLVIAFISDQFFFRESRESHLREGYRPIQEDEEDPLACEGEQDE